MKNKYVETFETYSLNEFNSLLKFNESKFNFFDKLLEKKPVLFLDWSYDVEDIDGNPHNVGEIIKKYVKPLEFSKLDNIHFFEGDLYNNKTKLTEYSLVFIGRIRDSRQNWLMVDRYCKLKEIPMLSLASSNNEKYKQLQELSSIGIKTPKTYTFYSEETCDVEFVESNFTYPMVLKPASGSQGEGVEIVKNRAGLKKALSSLTGNSFMIQEFIPNDCDYRVFFINNRYIFTVKRTRTDKKEFRNNVSLGAKAEFVELDYNELNMAKKAYEHMGLYVSGVDLVQNKESGEWYVLEVNSGPQYSIFGPKQITEKVISIFANDINSLRK